MGLTAARATCSGPFFLPQPKPECTRRRAGTVKQTLAIDDTHGNPALMDVCRDFLAVVTTKNYVRVYKVRVEAAGHGPRVEGRFQGEELRPWRLQGFYFFWFTVSRGGGFVRVWVWVCVGGGAAGVTTNNYTYEVRVDRELRAREQGAGSEGHGVEGVACSSPGRSTCACFQP